ncbi:hypothetical protein DH2020_001006 [Rehmannia glutinosa]|uniref:RNase H type-1 domain-containing protein n=1 Tax=Rehmannia glutinosa TaxID=99300 RepID=A0ABR0XY39_REHGL
MPDMLNAVSKISNENFENRFATLLWSLWYSRNNLVFQGKIISHLECFQMATKLLREFQDREKMGFERTHNCHPDSAWMKPPLGTIKLNVDASIKKGSGMGIRAVLRDHEGKVIDSLTNHFSPEYPIDIAETIACREGMLLARTTQCSNLLIETDCLHLAQSINNNQEDLSYLGNIIEDIRSYRSSFSSVSFSYIPRETNNLAHSLARHALTLSCNSWHSGPLPPEFVIVVVSEANSS